MNNISKGIAALMLLCFLSLSHSKLDKGAFVKFPKKDRIDLAAEQEFFLTRNPQSGEIHKSELIKAQRQLLLKSKGEQANAWQELGPSNVAGRIRSIIHTPSMSFPDQVYIGSASGGLWRCNDIRDEQPTWEELSSEIASLSVCAMHGDSSEIYFGTGEGYFSNNSFPGVGLFSRQADNSDNQYKVSTSTSDFRYIQSIIKNQQGDLLIATRDAGIQLSSNKGATWTKVLGTNNLALSDAANSLILLADGTIMASIGIHETDGVYISHNHGYTWSKIMNGLPELGFSRIELAASVKNRKIAYALVSNIQDGTTLGLYKTINQGVLWHKMTLPTAFGMSDFTRNQSWYNLTIATSPKNPNKLVVGGIDLFVSTNGGLTFTQITHTEARNGLPYLHPDQHEITFLNDNDILVGNDGGISLIENIFSTERIFTSKNKGLNITQFYACAIHPTEEIYLAGAQDNGTQRFEGKYYNQTSEVTGGDGSLCFIDQDNPSVQITSYIKNNYWVSMDGGYNFVYYPLNNNGLFSNPADYDDNKNILYAADAPGYFLRWKSPGTGMAAERVRLSATNDQITAVACSPTVSNRIYLGTSNGKVYRVDSAQSGTTKSAVQIFNGQTGTSVSDISIDVSAENKVLITIYNYGTQNVHYSSSAGTTWNAIEANLPDMPVRSSLLMDDQSAYLATEMGVWYAENVGSSEIQWTQLNQGMSNVRVDMLKYRKTDALILAATHGRGLYASTPYVPEDTEEEEEIVLIQANLDLQLNEDYAQGYSCFSGPKIISLICSLNIIPKEDISFDLVLRHQSTNSKDLSLGDNQLVFKTGKKYASIDLYLFDDAILEPKEMAQLTINTGEIEVEGKKIINISIEDNDFMPVVEGGDTEETMVGTPQGYTYEYPFKGYYEDQKTQIYFTAQELKSAGLQAGPISGLKLEVSNKKSDIPFQNFTISLDHTSSMGGIRNGEAFAYSGSQVFAGDYETSLGLNDIFFDSEFVWDGVSNLMLQMCFDNRDWSYNDQLVCDETSFYSVHYQYADSNLGCALNTIRSSSKVRPVVRFYKSSGNIKVASEEFEVSSSLSKYEELVFTNDKGQLIASLKAGSKDLGCVSLEIIGEGTILNCEHDIYCFSQKTFMVNTEFDEEYKLELFYNNDEIQDISANAWTVIETSSESIYSGIGNATIKEGAVRSPFGSSSCSFTFDHKGNGSFAIAKTKSGSKDNSEQSVLVSREFSEDRLSYFPNPFYDQLNLNISDALIGYRASITIFDLQGRPLINWNEVLTEKLQLNFNTILPEGIYFVRTETEDNRHFQQKISRF